MKKTIFNIIKIAVTVILTCGISSGIRALAGVINGEHGKPAFVTPSFECFAVITQLLLTGAYMMTEKYIPFKNKIIKGILFIILFWASDYVSQILGLSGAHSSIISEDALSLRTIITDSAGYLISGIIIGLLLSSSGNIHKRACSAKKLFLSAIVSMLVFPCVIFILELIAGTIDSDLSCMHAFGIAQNDKLSFYAVFYLFQAISGFIFPVFYRCTLFNSEHRYRWLEFASIYGLMLWTPVVLIVVFFGAELGVTLVFTAIMLTALYLDTYIYARLCEDHTS